MFARGATAAKICSSIRSSSASTPLQQREIAIDDSVHQRIQNIARATAQQLGLVFGACTHILKSSLDAAAHRKDVVVPDEDSDLTDP